MLDVLKIAGVPVEPIELAPKRISLLLWGAAGVGKTTLASTMPGKKLWLNFDPDGLMSIRHIPNIIRADYTASSVSVVEKFKEENPGGIEHVLKADNEIESIIFDSITSFGDMAMQHGIPHAASTVKHGEKPTQEDPGFKGYGRKYTWTMLAIKNVLRSASRFGCHTCFIAHESTPDKDKEGNVLHITMHMGGTALTEIPNKLSEIWYMYDTGAKRMIAVRKVRSYKPMKTRMFNVADGAAPEFRWDYDATTQEGEGINDWYKEWEAVPGKIPLPK